MRRVGSDGRREGRSGWLCARLARSTGSRHAASEYQPGLLGWGWISVLGDDLVDHIAGDVLIFSTGELGLLVDLDAGCLPGRPVAGDKRPEGEGGDVDDALDPPGGE
jgi:hypothetical protein